MDNPRFTPEAMKICPADGYTDLLYRTSEGKIEVFCRVPHGPDAQQTFQRAALLSAAPLMLQALSDLLEYEQPDGWGTAEDEGASWNNAFVACAEALAETIQLQWIPPDRIGELPPD